MAKKWERPGFIHLWAGERWSICSHTILCGEFHCHSHSDQWSGQLLCSSHDYNSNWTSDGCRGVAQLRNGQKYLAWLVRNSLSSLVLHVWFMPPPTHTHTHIHLMSIHMMNEPSPSLLFTNLLLTCIIVKVNKMGKAWEQSYTIYTKST